MVLALDRIACRGLVPNLTLLLDIDPDTSLARARIRNSMLGNSPAGGETRMDEQAAEFHRAAGDAYRKIVAGDPHRFRVIDGRADPDTVARAVWEAVKPCLPLMESHLA